jgi:DNA-binding response OmpR family regulator
MSPIANRRYVTAKTATFVLVHNMTAATTRRDVPAEILIVDDSPDDLQLLDEFLRGQGYQTRLALSGRQALELARSSRPDLLLLDANMPNMTGYEVCEQLRADTALREVPILFLSAMVAVTDKVRAFRAGAVDYVTKPFELEEVAARVRTQLELGQQRRVLKSNFTRLRELEHLRDNLVHMIVHDLRSSLTTIGLSLALLEQRLRPAVNRNRTLLRTALAGVSGYRRWPYTCWISTAWKRAKCRCTRRRATL